MQINNTETELKEQFNRLINKNNEYLNQIGKEQLIFISSMMFYHMKRYIDAYNELIECIMFYINSSPDNMDLIHNRLNILKNILEDYKKNNIELPNESKQTGIHALNGIKQRIPEKESDVNEIIEIIESITTSPEPPKS